MARRTVNFDSSFVDLGHIVACYDAVSIVSDDIQ